MLGGNSSSSSAEFLACSDTAPVPSRPVSPFPPCQDPLLASPRPPLLSLLLTVGALDAKGGLPSVVDDALDPAEGLRGLCAEGRVVWEGFKAGTVVVVP